MNTEGMKGFGKSVRRLTKKFWGKIHKLCKNWNESEGDNEVKQQEGNK